MPENNIRLNPRLISSLSSVLHMSAGEILHVTGISSTTWYRIMSNPETITIQQLLAIANSLQIPVKRFFYKDGTCFIGQRSDYVTSPYLECYYDADALQGFVADTSSATWKQTAEIVGVTRDNLRNSLLAVRRTPVTRFLQVCNIFGINPFTVLIDPNSDTNGQHPYNRNSVKSVAVEIKTLRNDVARLSGMVDDLTQKYNELSQQLQLIRHNNSRHEEYGGMAAEGSPEISDD